MEVGYSTFEDTQHGERGVDSPLFLGGKGGKRVEGDDEKKLQKKKLVFAI